MKYLLLLLLTCLLLFACNRTLEIPPRPPITENLYPIVNQKYRIYEVFDTTYNLSLSGGIDTISRKYYKKEVTNGEDDDILGRKISRLEIYEADTLTDSAFTFTKLWTQFRDASYAERIEGNVRILVLGFPIHKDTKWNGNEFNHTGLETFQYENLDTTVILPNLPTFNKCVLVRQRLSKSAINEIDTYEIYAPGIGKIVRYDRQIKTKNGLILNDAESYGYSETLIQHNY